MYVDLTIVTTVSLNGKKGRRHKRAFGELIPRTTAYEMGEEVVYELGEHFGEAGVPEGEGDILVHVHYKARKVAGGP